MRNKYPNIIFLFILIFTHNIFANNLNQEKKLSPLQIDANSIKHDDINLITTFEGNVVLVRGDLTIKGNRLVLEQTEGGLSFGYIFYEQTFTLFFAIIGSVVSRFLGLLCNSTPRCTAVYQKVLLILYIYRNKRAYYSRPLNRFFI